MNDDDDFWLAPHNTVHCRRKSTKACENGKPADSIYGPGVSQQEDGTYDPLTDTVVCTPCYVGF